MITMWEAYLSTFLKDATNDIYTAIFVFLYFIAAIVLISLAMITAKKPKKQVEDNGSQNFYNSP